LQVHCAAQDVAVQPMRLAFLDVSSLNLAALCAAFFLSAPDSDACIQWSAALQQ
jgi:hypothetical protein